MCNLKYESYHRLSTNTTLPGGYRRQAVGVVLPLRIGGRVYLLLVQLVELRELWRYRRA